MERKIVHIDMDAFFASVEQRDNPDLLGKPVIVGGRPQSRGVVAACSYEARVFGIHSAMPSVRAAKLCPDAVFLKPRFEAYREASKQIHVVFKRYASAIEPLSLDEAYLDVSEAAHELGSATEVARRIKQEILAETNLTASAGVSYNKFLAKIASDLDKPDGLAVITPAAAEAFIETLEIRKFHGVGKVTEKKMHKLGIFTGLDLKNLSLVQLQTHFGRIGEYYYNIARGIDNRAVSRSRKSKSIGSETTFVDNVLDKKLIWQTLLKLAEGVVASLDKRNYAARTITIKARYSDFELITRSKTPSTLLVSLDDFKEWMPELLKRTEVGSRPIRLIGVTAHNIVDRQVQEDNLMPSEEAPQLGLF
ncbi:MAG: DNA polymerase IV [Arenicella sp.]|mgnify:CR=1 FL=1|jgi:DNA polymerase-4|nr:DNA polymerase IV [Arenicella sp.]HAU67570.1 DNA polymerase IV [Gammaproteobacteria bacterium]